MEKQWKPFIGESCPNCGNSLEVLSESPETNDTSDSVSVYDGDEIRCVDVCGFKSSVDVTEEGNAYVQEGNLNKLG